MRDHRAEGRQTAHSLSEGSGGGLTVALAMSARGRKEQRLMDTGRQQAGSSR